MFYTFTITENASPGLAALIELKISSVLGVMATGMKVEVQNCFLQLPSNKYGYPSSGFYKKAARSTNVQIGTGDATVSVSGPVGITQRYFGGDIEAKPGHYLTIPAIAAAYDHRAREFPFLEFGFAKNRFGKLQPALIETRRTEFKRGAKRKDGTRKNTPTATVIGGGVYFWLVKSVHQDANKNILPTDEKLAEVAVAAGEAYVEQEKERGGLS